MAASKSTHAAPTEDELVQRARNAVSQCNWEVGFCAAEWTRRYARGRTDADFAGMVGLSPDQVYQRRRVAETFGEVHERFASLKWSHFYTALTWDDAAECLQWADENQATVAEMKAWRRAVRGEDLAAEPSPCDDFAGDPAVLMVSGRPTTVRDVPDAPPGERGTGSRASTGNGERAQSLAGVSRQSNGDDYAPFRSGAGSPAPEVREDSPPAGVVEHPSALRVFKRAAASLERINQALTPDVLEGYSQLPRDVKRRFAAACAELQSKIGEIV